jgi:tRNA dimethylallyltransferase
MYLEMKKSKYFKPEVVFIVGPTAVGKSEVAFYLAKKIRAEIISSDSMQVYKGMDIITSKPGPSLTKKVKHHLVNTIPLNKSYDVSSYRKDALGKVEDIISRGRVPVFVGGTGLYMTILADGIFEGKSGNDAIRKKLYKIAKNKGSAYLHNQLKVVDPSAANKIHPNDTKRIIRALEVYKSSGKPISLLQKQRIGLRGEYDVKIFCLNMKREELYKRINGRVEKMLKKGLIKEVKGLLKKRLSRTASFAIGIKEIKGYLRGDYDLDTALDMIKLNTRRYAKRQLTWFRKDKNITWINIKAIDTATTVARKIIGRLGISS